MVGKNLFVLQPTVNRKKQPVQDAAKLDIIRAIVQYLRPKFGTVVSAENQDTTKCLVGDENTTPLATPFRQTGVGWVPTRGFLTLGCKEG